MEIPTCDLDGEPLGVELSISRIMARNRVQRIGSSDVVTELLVDYSRDQTGEWYQFRIARVPHKTASGFVTHGCSAVPLTPPEAKKMIQTCGIEVPTDLKRDTRDFDRGRYRGKHRAWLARPSIDYRPNAEDLLPSRQQEVWELLDGRAMRGTEIAIEIHGSRTMENAVRKSVKAICDSGREIRNVRGRGYYRPDAPPPDLAS